MSTPNYWQWKIEEIKQMITDRELDIDTSAENFNRKEAIEAIKIDDVKRGEADEALEQDDETGDVEEVKKTRTEVVKVRFHNTREDTTPYVFCGLNGKSYYIPKEEDIYIPKKLLDACIDDAVEEHTRMVTLPNGKIQHEPYKIHRFPYTLLRD